MLSKLNIIFLSLKARHYMIKVLTVYSVPAMFCFRFVSSRENFGLLLLFFGELNIDIPLNTEKCRYLRGKYSERKLKGPRCELAAGVLLFYLSGMAGSLTPDITSFRKGFHFLIHVFDSERK